MCARIVIRRPSTCMLRPRTSWRASRSARVAKRVGVRMRVGVGAFVLPSLLAIAPTAAAQTTDVSLGIEALARRDVRGAEEAFRRATTSKTQSVRAGGYQWLAHLAWKI